MKTEKIATGVGHEAQLATAAVQRIHMQIYNEQIRIVYCLQLINKGINLSVLMFLFSS